MRSEGRVGWSDIGRQPVFDWTCDDGTVVSPSWREGEVQVAGGSATRRPDPRPGWLRRRAANLVGDEHERYEPKP